MIRKLQKYCAEKQPIELIYSDRDGNISQRKIKINAVHDLYIIAYCYQKKAIRSFSHDQILAVAPLPAKRPLRHKAS